MSGMVEKRGISYWLTHVGLSSGVLVLFFPLWLAFVASTVTNSGGNSSSHAIMAW